MTVTPLTCDDRACVFLCMCEGTKKKRCVNVSEHSMSVWGVLLRLCLDGASMCVSVCVCVGETVRQTLDNLIITFSKLRLDWRLRCFVVEPIGLNTSLHLCVCFSPLGTEDDEFAFGLPALVNPTSPRRHLPRKSRPSAA